MIQFTVYGIPKPKARARVVTHHGNTRAFTPDTTASWEDSVRAQALAHRPERLLDGPLRATLLFWLPKPKSKKNDALPDTKPDLDNLSKSIFDALEGLIYTNDSRFVAKRLSKEYAIDCSPGVMVCISEVTPHAPADTRSSE